jgi:protein-L-isoaspartate(D-aspartate) O-methyltransferase
MSASQACLNMIKQQLRTNNVLNQNILKLFSEPTRFEFISPSLKDFAYSDMHIPLAHEQIMLTPLEEALILESGQFHKNDVVLEIGTGSGYLSYLLSKICKKVVSIDIHPDFIEHAKTVHQKLKVDNVELMTQDAMQLREFPFTFDAIICTSGLEFLPKEWFNLLGKKAKIFAPMGEKNQNAQWFHIEDRQVRGHEFVFQTKVPMLINHQKEKFIF